MVGDQRHEESHGKRSVRQHSPSDTGPIEPLAHNRHRYGQVSVSPHRPVIVNRVCEFDSDMLGNIANGFMQDVGTWEVVRDGDNPVMAQKAKSSDSTFNVALVADTQLADLDLKVRMKANAGDLDRVGGLVWRAKDKDNYYVARYNPLEDNFRVYKVQAGKRTQFQSASIPGDTKWHTMRVTMKGSKITCYLDDTKHLEVEDSTFAEAGKIGLWSKADAQSYFDDLVVTSGR
jgi:hypothetical protein